MNNSYIKSIENILKSLNLKTNNIYIIGKGNSLRDIDTTKFEDSVIININDSEKIYEGHFSLVHSNWAIDSIKENGYRADMYLSDKDFCSKGIKLPFYPIQLEDVENKLSTLVNDNLFISDFLFLTAIKLSRICANILGKKMNVFFIGFDFKVSENNIIKDYSKHSTQYTNVVLRTQEDFFEKVKKHIDSTIDDINISHIGDKHYSSLSVISFNNSDVNELVEEKKNNKSLYLDLLNKVDKEIPIIIAELTNNHIGDKERLIEMIKLSKQQGADAIKVQKRDVSTFYTEEELRAPYSSPFGTTLSDYRSGVELNDELFDVLIEECRKHQIFWFASVLDKPSYEYMLKYNVPLIKLPSTISNHRNYLKHVASTFEGDVVVSTGFTDSTYEEFVLNTFIDKERLFLLQCTSSYPAPPDSCNIGVVNHYSKLRYKYPNIRPGYSSHDVGSFASQLSVGAGALMIEKHVKLGDLDWVHFDGVALDIKKNEFADFVNDVKEAVLIKGDSLKKVDKNEHHKYKVNKNNN
ncbi:MAG: N-acetylneuraminate synthase family protein [Flavobacteriaceae bacterium]|nr:N-acetylneuraminate synthase family protein [Flavobacteriaceae bacterium]